MFNRVSQLRPLPAIVVSFVAVSAPHRRYGRRRSERSGPQSTSQATSQAVKKSKIRKIATNKVNKAITQRAPTLEVLFAQTVADNVRGAAKPQTTRRPRPSSQTAR